MLLERILQDLVGRVSGARAAILADWEGEAVVTYCDSDDDYEIKFIGAHHGILLDRVREVGERLDSGETQEIIFVLENFKVVTVPVNNEYYLVLTMGPKANPAGARPSMRKAAKAIRDDIG